MRLPSCPKWLAGEAKKEWKRAGKLLVEMRVVTDADLAVLAMYCDAWREYIEAAADLARDGCTFETEKGYVGLSPMVAVRNAAYKRTLVLAQQLGLTPASRPRLRAAPDEDDVDEDLDDTPARRKRKGPFFDGA